MSWCPKCKYEYREGFTNCSSCGCDLVEVLETPKEEVVEENNEMFEEDVEALLVSVSKEFEAKIVESKLTAFDIPSLKKYRGIDNIYGFANSSGIDIYVPAKLLNHAKEILDNESV